MNSVNIYRFVHFIIVSFSLCWLALTASTVQAISLKEDNVHVRNWNQFATDLYEYHKKYISNKKITIKSKTGGYATQKEFYLEKEFYDENGRLLSRVAWELEAPQDLHVIEIFIYNSKGKVIRDYSAAYLPVYRNAPTQTLISLHHYNQGLHAFRTFDASGDRILERCEGQYNTKTISFMLDEDELYELIGDETGFMYSKDYKLCFDNLQENLGQYLKPQ